MGLTLTTPTHHRAEPPTPCSSPRRPQGHCCALPGESQCCLAFLSLSLHVPLFFLWFSYSSLENCISFVTSYMCSLWKHVDSVDLSSMVCGNVSVPRTVFLTCSQQLVGRDEVNRGQGSWTLAALGPRE